MQMGTSEQEILLSLELVHLLCLVFEEISCLLELNLLVIAHEAAGDCTKTLTVNRNFYPVSDYRTYACMLPATLLSIRAAPRVGQVPIVSIPALAIICDPRALVTSSITSIFAHPTSSLLLICLLMLWHVAR